jgi:putative NADH-flavin reductase
LLSRGHAVIAIARRAENIGAGRLTACPVDACESAALSAAIAGSDAVISAARFQDLPAQAVIDAVKLAQVPRLLVVGGAASLRGPSGQRLIDSPNFPAAYLAEATAGVAFFDALRSEPTLDWTFLSPGAIFDGAKRTGQFRLGHDDLLADAQGKSSISFPDSSIAMVDELEKPGHSRQRFHAAC